MKKQSHELRKDPLRVAVYAAVIGAVVGSILTYTVPHVLDALGREFAEEETAVALPDLLSWYGDFANHIHADREFERRYKGKAVTWSGTVNSVHRDPWGGGLLACRDSLKHIFICMFNSDEELLAAGRNDRVHVRGRIGNITRSFVSLEDCTVVSLIPEGDAKVDP